MLAFERNDDRRKPDDFDDRVAPARTRLAELVARGERPGDSKFFDKDKNQPWVKYKYLLRRWQHGKCGYCEALLGNQAGDVEHYAPKSKIERIASRAPTRRRRRDPDRTEPYPTEDVNKERGYDCLAYEWENYLFACSDCNSVHKRAIFPVKHPSDPPCATELAAQEPYLLHPYEAGLRPAAHFVYPRRGLGLMESLDDRGWHTIETCRLNREEVRSQRQEVAAEVFALIEKLLDAYESGHRGDRKRIEDKLARLGGKERPFAGMVRVIYECEMRVPWRALVE